MAKKKKNQVICVSYDKMIETLYKRNNIVTEHPFNFWTPS